MSRLSLTSEGLRRAATQLVPTAVIAIFLARAWVQLWSKVGTPESSFGVDLPAYVGAAHRLVATGSPYSAELLEGPLARLPDSILVGYLYPPPLAQLFVPLRNIDPMWLAIGWSLAQVIILGWLLVAVSVGARGRLDRFGSLAAIALAVASFPFQSAIYSGNVSGWVATAVAVMLLGSGRLAGAAAGLAAVVKVIPGPLALAALVAPRSRPAVVSTGLLLVVGSFVLSPASWAAWWSVLPNLAPLEPDGVSLAFILGDTPLAKPAAIAGLAISVAFMLAAVRRTRRVGLDRAAVACAVGSYLFVVSALWDHYLAALVPLMVATWPSGNRWQRAAIIAGAVTQSLPWFWAGGKALAAFELAGALVVLLASAHLGRGARHRFVTPSSVEISAP